MKKIRYFQHTAGMYVQNGESLYLLGPDGWCEHYGMPLGHKEISFDEACKMAELAGYKIKNIQTKDEIRVHKIHAEGVEATEALYRACEETFSVPPWSVIQEALHGEMKKIEEYLKTVPRDHHPGPRVWGEMGEYPSIRIITEGGRQIDISQRKITICFDRNITYSKHGSIYCAGQLIGLSKEKYDGDDIEITVLKNDGDRHATKHYCLESYPGLVHPRLGSAAHIAEFKMKMEGLLE